MKRWDGACECCRLLRYACWLDTPTPKTWVWSHAFNLSKFWLNASKSGKNVSMEVRKYLLHHGSRPTRAVASTLL
jgi:hypothetical protein